MFFFGPISSSALQSFANKIIFISHKKSFLGRIFITTKINFILQKDFHFDLGQTIGMIQEFLFGSFLPQGFQKLVGIKSFIYLRLFYLRFKKNLQGQKRPCRFHTLILQGFQNLVGIKHLNFPLKKICESVAKKSLRFQKTSSSKTNSKINN